MKIPFYLVIVIAPTMAFQCFRCNNGIDDKNDNVKQCIDQKIECPKGTKSCSTILYTSEKDNEIHIRKFCTTPGTPIPHYLRLFPSSAICENIFTNQDEVQLTSLLKERRRREASPPAPPRQYKNNLLCICATSLCNGGIQREIIDRITFDPPRHNIDLSLQQLND
ncbi:hypothetical protein QQG55_28500 [Brugia pahangi]